MIIDTTAWLWALIGGLTIGGAAALFLLVNGRVMGASGILGGLVDGSGTANRNERIAFVVGLIGAPAVIALIHSFPDTNITDNRILIILGGLLVGVGTRMANGCTSGHGVCGISRFSVRGIVATLAYLGFGMLTMLILRTGLGVI